MQRERLRDMNIGSTVIIIDRDFGRLVFRDVKGYGNLLDDAEWLLERTAQRSWGFIMRPVIHGKQIGLWIGEYTLGSNKVIREEILFGRGPASISRLLLKYSEGRVGEKEINRRLSIDTLKKALPESRIIQDFKYFTCPEGRLYSRCPGIEDICRLLREKVGSEGRLSYSQVAEIISKAGKCNDVIICPLLAPPNTLERILILDRVLRSRKIGAIEILNGGIVKVSLAGKT